MSGSEWYWVIRVPGMVVATANPTPEKAAQTLRTTTEGNITVISIDMPKVSKPKR